MKYRDVASRRRTLGCTEIARKGGGSHRKWFNPTTQRGIVVRDWGGKDLKLGTSRAAVRQLGAELGGFRKRPMMLHAIENARFVTARESA